MNNERVSVEEEAALRDICTAVAADLQFVGIPVNDRGDASVLKLVKKSGAAIFYDPSRSDASGGVFVTWRPTTDLFEAAMEAGPNSRPARIGGAALDAMLAAITCILSEAGWSIESEAIGVHESCIKVVGSA